HSQAEGVGGVEGAPGGARVAAAHDRGGRRRVEAVEAEVEVGQAGVVELFDAQSPAQVAVAGHADRGVGPEAVGEPRDDVEDVGSEGRFTAGAVRLPDLPGPGLGGDGRVVGGGQGPVLVPVVRHAPGLAEHAVQVAQRVQGEGQVGVVAACGGEGGGQGVVVCGGHWSASYERRAGGGRLGQAVERLAREVAVQVVGEE